MKAGAREGVIQLFGKNEVGYHMEQSRLGTVEVTPTAIASLASQVVLECYGVVGMATKDLARGIVEILQPASHRRGVEIEIGDDDIAVDLYVVIEYGTRIAVVARNIQSSVKYTLEKALGVPVAAVNVHVQDLRVSAD
jgi:uncharacterized alkaline shock family protein YloU